MSVRYVAPLFVCIFSVLCGSTAHAAAELAPLPTASAPAPDPSTPSAKDSSGADKAKSDELAKSLNLTPDTKSLPVWSQPGSDAVTALLNVVRKSSPSVFIVGNNDVGTGTAFLISKKNRLLATNAHVADIFNNSGGNMLAYQNGTSNAFKVVKAYYHPGVMRFSAGVLLRNSSPSTGNVCPRSPDVAVLQLADDGAELPDELPLATRDEEYDLFAQPIGMLGYPSLDTGAVLPAPGQKATATFREGVIDRVSDFSNYAGGPPERQQYLQHSMASWFGFSGSPIFLPNGHVAALNNSGGTFTQNGMSTNLAWGIRADCLWELLKANNLLDKVNVPPEAAAVDIERFSQPDPQMERLQKVNALLADASIDYQFSRHEAAIEKCNEAAKELPDYAAIYGLRGKAYLDYGARNFKLTDPQFQKYDQLALADENRAVQLDPSNTDYYLEVAMANCYLANLNMRIGQRKVVPASIELADRIIDNSNSTPQNKVFAYRIRANAMAFAPGSLEYLQKADQLIPSDDSVHWTMYLYYENNKNPTEAARQQQLSTTLKAARAKSDTAWKLSTSSDDAKRDGHRAFDLANEACTSTDFKCYYAVAALAAAYAECKDFSHAIEYQQKALAIAPQHKHSLYNNVLASYQEHKPWRVH
jgi:tetratricopeptide (TPR) repeat protein